MRRWVPVLALLSIVLSCAVGCSKSATPTGSTTVGADPGSTPVVSAASHCPATPQRTLVKTRFAADLGLIIGTTRHFIYKPFTQGGFAQGAHGRLRAIFKAGVAAAAVLHLTHNAVDNAAADPTLCRLLIQPLTAISTALEGIKTKLLTGDVTSISGLGSTLGSLESTAKSHGLAVVSSVIPGL